IRFSDMIDPSAIIVAVVALLSMVGYAIMMTFLTPYMVGRDLADAASAFFLVWACSMLAIRLVSGRAHDLYGDNGVRPVSFVTIATGLGVLSFAYHLWQFMLAAVRCGVGHFVIVPSLHDISVRRTSPYRVPIATAIYYLALDLGLAIGPVALAFMVQ